jgi:hypothetical protein
MRGAFVTSVLITGWLLQAGCRGRPVAVATDAVVVDAPAPADGGEAPADVAVRADVVDPYADARYPLAPDGASICQDVLIVGPQPVPCNDGTGLNDCCPDLPKVGDACDPCWQPPQGCYSQCVQGVRYGLSCDRDGRGGWVFGIVQGLMRPCTANDNPISLDGGPVYVTPEACDDGTGRTDCCPAGAAQDVLCFPPDPRTQPSPDCWTRCASGTTTHLVCNQDHDFFTTAETATCSSDGGP